MSAPALRSALRGLALAIAATGLLALAPASHGASKNKKASATTHAPAKKRSTRVKPSQNHSGESTAEREKRLYRECQGMPNAGACLGYAKR
ncbi:hypothetical protein [Comamonas flocculans]|uniref:hypothetical protein n=1 Tax=Comamonas flocculans TaxID=2597701 RepID=UPI001647427B|nr:hypothetical protein [Comamonas flocculans]